MNEIVEADEGKMLGQIALDKVRERISTKPAGGRIPIDCNEWDEYGLICKRYNISKSYSGFLDMVQSWNKDARVFFPLADRYHCDPLTFKNEMIDAILYIVSSLDKKGMTVMIEKVVVDRNNIVTSMDKSIKDEMRKVMKNILGADF